MATQNGKIWFPAKRYGWGWGAPVCWQGWAVLVIFMILLAAGAAFLKHRQPLGNVAYVLSLSAALALVCWIKGEKPGWRWGKK